MKLALVGSRKFNDRGLVERVIKAYLARYGELIVVSGGCPDGADYIAKEVALSWGLPYQEYPPAHRPHNPYCVEPPDFYGHPYRVANYFLRNTQVAENCDHLVAFVRKGIPSNGTNDTVGKARRFGKSVVVIEV